MEYYNDILCISYDELTAGIITKDMYKWYRKKKRIKRVQRGCYGTPALVDVKSLPSKILAAVKAKYGEDLEQASAKHTIKGAYQVDSDARTFYETHLLPSGEHLEKEFIEEYTINASMLNAINYCINDRVGTVRSLGGGVIKGKWADMSALVNAAKYGDNPIKHTLPENSRRLQWKLEEYRKEGYKSLISGKHGNKNTEKVPEQAKIWLLTRWTDNVKKVASINQLFQEYNEKTESMTGWAKIKSDKTIYNFLYSPEIKPLWWAHRYGELAAKEKYSYMHKTLMPTMRDSIWYSDGTKLNYYYQYSDSEGKSQIGTLQVYEVMDAYSEVFLGYHISKHEDFEAQFMAYKMAFEFSKYKPYQITYDNQGGHKKLENSDFLQKLAHLSIKTAPYNGRSKTIESAFGRFQQQVLKKDWFFTGQNITATSAESRANMEFVMANKQLLPTEAEIRQTYAERRQEWNNMPHHKTGVSRLEMYQASQNPQAVKVELWDIIDLFYITREKEVTCTAWGITFREKNIKYDYMVNGADNMPDLEWLQTNIDRKFVIKFDPANMDVIFLYEKTPSGLRYNTVASTKVAIHRGKQEQEDFEAQYIKDIEIANKKARLNRYEKMSALQKEAGTSLDDYGFKTPALLGIQTSKAAKRTAKNHMGSVGIGSAQKAISNADYADQEEFDPYEYARKSM
jgi:hypothetical protein